MKRIIFFLFFLSPFLLQAKEKPVVTWLVFDLKPSYFVDGPLKGKGAGDFIRNRFIAEVPEFKNEILVANAPRVHKLMLRTEETFCLSTMFRLPKFHDKVYFSQRLSGLGPPIMIVTTRKKWSLFRNQKKMFLEKVLQNKRIRAGIPSRSFGNLDPLIEKYKDKVNVSVIVTEDENKSLFKMLIRDRIDFVLDYPMGAFYLAQQIGKSEEIVMISIEEALEHTVGYLGCSQTETGLRVVQKVEAVLKNKQFFFSLIEEVSHWLDDNGTEAYREAMMKKIINHL